MYRSIVISYAAQLWSLLDSLELVCYDGSSLVYHTALYNKTSSNLASLDLANGSCGIDLNLEELGEHILRFFTCHFKL